jgi:hypothetical protein
VAAEAKIGEFKPDGFTADGRLRGIMRGLCSHAQPCAVRKLLVGRPGGGGKLRVLHVSCGPIRVDRDASLKGDVLLRNTSAVTICDDAVFGAEFRWDLSLSEESSKGARLATAGGFVVSRAVLPAVLTGGLYLPSVCGEPGG